MCLFINRENFFLFYCITTFKMCLTLIQLSVTNVLYKHNSSISSSHGLSSFQADTETQAGFVSHDLVPWKQGVLFPLLLWSARELAKGTSFITISAVCLCLMPCTIYAYFFMGRKYILQYMTFLTMYLC